MGITDRLAVVAPFGPRIPVAGNGSVLSIDTKQFLGIPHLFLVGAGGFQIAKSVYSGFTASVGGNSIPAPTVALVPCSINMNEPVSRLVL